MSFSSFKLHPKIAANVKALGYETPTPIQAQAIPPVLAGRDVMGLAQTGHRQDRGLCAADPAASASGPRGNVRALIVAPTRELAEQIHCLDRRAGTQHRPEELHDLRRRQHQPADPEAARRRRHRRRLPGPSARPPQPEDDRPFAPRGPRPRRGGPDVRHGLPARHPPDRQTTADKNARRSCSRRPCRQRSGSWPTKCCTIRSRCRSAIQPRHTRSPMPSTRSSST